MKSNLLGGAGRTIPTAVHLGPKAFALLAVTELEVTHRLRHSSSLHNKLQQLVPGREAVALLRLLCTRPLDGRQTLLQEVARQVCLPARALAASISAPTQICSAAAMGAANDSTSNGARFITSRAVGHESVIQKYRNPACAPSVEWGQRAVKKRQESQ